jgi:hypothetical protein
MEQLLRKRDVGFDLLERTAKSVRLTDAGKYFSMKRVPPSNSMSRSLKSAGNVPVSGPTALAYIAKADFGQGPELERFNALQN